MSARQHAEQLVSWAESQLGHPVSNRADAVRRLAAIGDDGMRGMLGELLVCAERNADNAGFEARRAEEEHRAEREEKAWLTRVLDACCRGEYGPGVRERAVDFAQSMAKRGLPASLPELRAWRSTIGAITRLRRGGTESRGRRAAE